MDLAWTWPTGGPVLRPFVVGSDPYAGGQHRGIELAGQIGGGGRGPAPGGGPVAGTGPAGGKNLSLRTQDGDTV